MEKRRFVYNADWTAEGSSGEGNDKSQVFSNTDRRIFCLYGDVNTRNCADIAFDITAINMEDDSDESEKKDYKRRPIRIYFNSYGGSVYDMWLLTDTILGSRTPVYTYCTGYAMSAAFIAFLSGHKRFMSRHATLMYHQIYCWRSGKYQDLVEDREHLDHLNESIEAFVMERTGLTEKDLEGIRERKQDAYFSADTAKKLGIVDEVMADVGVEME